MNCVGHIQHGMWTYPRDRSIEYNTIQYWKDLARLAERGKFYGNLPMIETIAAGTTSGCSLTPFPHAVSLYSLCQ